MWGFANGFERVVQAVMHGAGTYVRSLGEDAVTMAIVNHLYRYDSVQHDTTIDLRDGSQFGIDDNQLARLVALLVRNDIFDTDRAPYYVRLTEHGREWFEANLRPPAPAATAQEEEQADASQPPNSSGEINVDEITSYLSFMDNDELRGFVLDDLREINLAFAAGANLSTMILCGSSVEGMVLDIAEQVSPAKLTFASKPNWADSISLPKIVAEFASLGLLPRPWGRATHPLADAKLESTSVAATTRPRRRRLPTYPQIEPRAGRRSTTHRPRPIADYRLTG